MTLATRLLLMVALALTPPLVFGIINDVSQRNSRTEAIDETALAQSRSLQDSLSLVTAGVRHLLSALAEAPAIRARDPAACTAYLRAVSARSEGYRLFAAIDRNGDVICNDAGSAPGAYSVANRTYFRRAMSSGRFSSGDLVTSIIAGQQAIHFAMPFMDVQGAPAGVVVASIERGWLANQLAAETTPGGGQGMIIDPSGIVVAAAQDGASINADWIGAPAPPALLAALDSASPRVVELRAPDGRLRLFGIMPAKPSLAGNRAVIGIDRERAFADLRAASRRNLLGLGVGAILALLGGMFAARRFVLNPVARVARAADRVAAGDLQTRAELRPDLGELNDLAESFNRMAAALAAREQERAAAETALRREEARLRLALAAADLGTFEWDIRTDRVQPSDSIRAMFGFGPEEGFKGGDYFARMVPQDLVQLRRDIQSQLASGRIRQSYRIVRDGQQRHILTQAEIVEDADGSPLLIGLLADETERIENIQALRDSEARFQAIADCIDQMVWSNRPDGYVDYFNHRWYEFTGTVPGPTDGDAWTRVLHPDDLEETGKVWAACLASGQFYHRELRVRHRSGRFRWTLARAQAVRDEGGRIVRWYGTCTDIDEIVQARDVLARSREVLTQEIASRTAELMAAEEQLRQSQKMEAVGQLTGGIAHDFNNMLQAIGGALELMVRRVDQNKLDDARRFAGIARATVDRAAALTHRLLAFARRQTLSPEPVDVAALVDGMIELVGRTVGPAIDIAAEPGQDVQSVLCDRNQLENVLFNLCINARDAMPEGGKLRIAVRNVALGEDELVGAEEAVAGDYVEVAITDTGTGMDEATKARAFEPFFTTKPLGQGTGLGLSQVYGFVRQSGGFVRLESALGVGTTVRLFLPRHGAAPSGVGDLPGRCVLLIENDGQTRAAVALELQELGFTTHESDGTDDVMRIVAEMPHPPGMLVTAVGLPGHVNGRQIAEAARSRWPELPVLFITRFTGSLAGSELGGATSVIAVPVDASELREKVATLAGEMAG